MGIFVGQISDQFGFCHGVNSIRNKRSVTKWDVYLIYLFK
jgi:hypothetical protein